MKTLYNISPKRKTPKQCTHLLLIKDVMHKEGYLVYECCECEEKKRPKDWHLKGRELKLSNKRRT